MVFKRNRKRLTLRKRRKYSELSASEVVEQFANGELLDWPIPDRQYSVSPRMVDLLSKLESFDTESPAGRLLFVDHVLLEVLPNYSQFRAWKGVPLLTRLLTGKVDYLIAYKFAYLTEPFFFVCKVIQEEESTESLQCLSQMAACRRRNRSWEINIPIFGIVNAKEFWRFYQLTLEGRLFRSKRYPISELPRLLGTVDFVCEECTKNVPPSTT